MLGRLKLAQSFVVLLSGHKWLLFRFVIDTLLRAGLGMATVLLIQEFLGGILGGAQGLGHSLTAEFGPAAALWVMAGLLLFCYVLTSLASYDGQVAEQRIVRAVELGIIDRLIRHLMTLSVAFFDRHSHGDLIQAIRQDVTHTRSVLAAMVRLVLEAVTALGFLTAAFWMSPRLAFWSLLVLPLAVAPIIRVARKTLERSFAVRRRASVLYDVILQIIRGIRVIKVYRGEEQEARRASGHASHYFEASIAITRSEAMARVFLESIAGLSIVVVVIAGGFQVLRGELGWPALLAFLLAVRSLHSPLNNLNAAVIEIQKNHAAFSRVTGLLQERPSVMDRKDANPLTSAPDVISFDGVSFGYEQQLVLDGIAFHVAAGETLGIVGPSGAGKTTVLGLLARFFDPTAGTVRFDGVDIRTLRLADLYRAVALVPQDPFLFSDTVAENIRCGRPEATDEELFAAAQAAQIHDEILQWPDRYQTRLGIGGRGISEGQAQRINIARALLKNAPILLLDEATSSLDSISEIKVQHAIDSLVAGRTTFVVAHRLSTLRNANRILVIDQGRAAGLGSHEELLTSCALYRSLWEQQDPTRDATGVPA